MTEPAPTLKCIVAWSDRRNLCDIVGQTLASAGETDAIRLNEDSWIICTHTEPAALRDLVTTVLAKDESALVFEFERWSSSGRVADSRWLLRRGH